MTNDMDRLKEPESWRQFLSKDLPKDEKGLAALLVRDLCMEGWTVYQEVAFGKLIDRDQRELFEGRRVPWQAVCDIVAVKGTLAMAVEVKKTFSLQLIEQAITWARIFPLVAMAVPVTSAVSQHTGVREHLRKYYGIGLCSLSANHTNWQYRPRLLRHNLRCVPALTSVLTLAMANVSEAGAAHTYRVTPYQMTMETVRWLLAVKGPMRICDIACYLEEHALYHWSSTASMKSGLAAAINKNEPDFVRTGHLVSWNPELCRYGDGYVSGILGRTGKSKKQRNDKQGDVNDVAAI